MKEILTHLVYRWKGDGKLNEIQCKIKLKTKYNLIAGMSGTGKSTIEHLMLNDIKYKSDKCIIDYNKISWLIISDYNTFITNNLNNYDVVFVSENVSRFLNNCLSNKERSEHTVIHRILEQSTCKFIFVNRSMATLTIDYKSVFEIENIQSIDVVKPAFYKNYPFITSDNYLVEDETTGYEYYNYHYNNVRHANGRDKLSMVCKSGDTVIADGSALGNNPILRKHNINLYLPESFEFDLANAWKPNDTLVKDYYKNMPDNTDSVEQYFENTILPDLCEKNHIPRYKKYNKLHHTLLNVNIHTSTHNKLLSYYNSVNLDYNTQVKLDAELVSEYICDIHSINYDDIEARAYLALQLSNKL